MFEVSLSASSTDRLRVFISSPIGECASERAQARKAILELNLQPVQFEREGARSEPPRDFYLRKLLVSHGVIGIYRNLYGWIDAAKGMTISGLEDEYREIVRLNKDLLAYVLKTPVGRDPRLASLIEEIMGRANVIYFYDDGEELTSRIRDDLTAFISDRVSRYQALQTSGSGSAAATLRGIFGKDVPRIRRAALLDALTQLSSLNRVVWITGAPGAGKTALTAEWSEERGAAYVNARGLDPRTVLLEAARVLGVAEDADLATPLFDEARTLLISRWSRGSNWPLVIDAPDDPEVVWSVISECLFAGGTGSAVIVSREAGQHLPGARFQIQGFSDTELEALRALSVGGFAGLGSGSLPLDVRTAEREKAPSHLPHSEMIAGIVRETLSYVALSPAPLSLVDLLALLGPSAPSAVNLTEQLALIPDLMETAAGFVFVHETLGARLASDLEQHPQLRALMAGRLTDHLAETGRVWAAFALRRQEQSAATEYLARRAAEESAFTGATGRLVDALDFLVGYYRLQRDDASLLFALTAQADALANRGRPDAAPALLDEALKLASSMEDIEAERSITIMQAIITLRRSASVEALEAVRSLRRVAHEQGHWVDEGRLFLEEGTALLAANETERAVPLFREALALFEAAEDDYGVEVATRNLIASLATVEGGETESNRLRAKLAQAEVPTPRYRAWLCDLLVPRLRNERRYSEAEAMAREAISIGEQLGDRYVVAINQIVLGNVFREAGKPREALDAYSVGGRVAQEIGRPDIEGRSSRLLALTEIELAEEATASERIEHSGKAEQYASHAVGLLSQSYAWGEYGYALEERGNARRLLNREAEALVDYAGAIAAYRKAEDEDDVSRLLRNVCGSIDDGFDLAPIIATAFGREPEEGAGASSSWIEAVVGTVQSCPPKAAPRVLGALIRGFLTDIEDDEWWFACLIRCLIMMRGELDRAECIKNGSLLLLSILAFSPKRSFSVQDLLTLAGLCSGTGGLERRHQPGGDLVQILWIGRDDKVLLTIRDDTKNPETLFCSLLIGAFLDAFGADVARILFEDDTLTGAALDITVLSERSMPDKAASLVKKALTDAPVAPATIMPTKDEEVPIILFVRSDAIDALIGRSDRAGEIEITLAKVMDVIAHVALGQSIDDEIYRRKMLDLLKNVLG